jgi:hypothetical protein
MYFNEERALAVSASPAVPEPTLVPVAPEPAAAPAEEPAPTLAPVAPEPAATPAEEPAPTLAPEPTSAPSADVFTFRNGVTWDTPVEKMLLAEGAQDGTDYETFAYGPNETYMFTTTDDAGNELQVAYAFHDGLPVFMAAYFVSDTEAGFAARREEYAAQYGEPTETDADAMFALFDIVSMGTVEHDSVQDFAGWLLKDGTRAYLLLADGEVYIFFMNEARILAVYGGEAAEPFEFRDGITWATTVEEMLAIEGTDYGPEKSVMPGTGHTAYVFSGAPLDGETVDFAYYYIGDQLVIAAYHYPNDDPEDFAARRDRVSARYGEPAETDIAEVAELFGLITGETDITEQIDAFASWSLADGTQIILSDMQGDITMYCFNGPAMPDVYD